MTLRMDIGEEADKNQDMPEISKHVLSLKKVDKPKKEKARENVSLDLKDLKEEIKFKKERGRICIVGELPRSKQGLGRAPIIVSAVLMIFVLNFGQLIFLGKSRGNEALALAGEAFLSLQTASESFVSGEPGSESILFSQAESLFNAAEEKGSFLLSQNSNWLSEPAKVHSLRNLIESGKLMSEVGQHMGNVRAAFDQFPEEGSITEHLRKASEDDLEPAAAKFKRINQLLDEVDISGTGYEADFDGYRDKLNSLSEIFDLWLAAKEPLLTVLGDKLPQHYLILLQNNDEIRPGGGFIGSYAVAMFNDGRLADLEFKDVYEIDNLYNGFLEIPVPEIRELTDNWRFRDSNVYADFPTTANSAMNLFDIQGGPGVDGVIAINLSAAQAMLGAIGPLEIPSLPKALTAEAFPAVTSTMVEAKSTGETTPKAIVGELIDAFVAKLESPIQHAALGATLLNEINKKQILFYHKDDLVQDFIASVGMDAAIPQLGTLDGDFFMLNATNIGGHKSPYMTNDINHHTEILSDGSIVNSLTLTRSNNFTEHTLAWLKNITAEYGFTSWHEGLEKLQGNAADRTALRLYVPEGVQILNVFGSNHRDDFQLYYDPENDISYYYLDQIIAPGETQSFTMQYVLPWSISDDFESYDFHIFKQPGLKAINYRKTVTAPHHILLSSEPLATESQEETDYIKSGPLKGDESIKLLYRSN
ncbi:DUF4012 domain-containing protein [Candidatus Peregrinibacteria bacterium]|nr:DUF4012 domain-containing protein [Candidatus Peregrinibacteria bacterium]